MNVNTSFDNLQYYTHLSLSAGLGLSVAGTFGMTPWMVAAILGFTIASKGVVESIARYKFRNALPKAVNNYTPEEREFLCEIRPSKQKEFDTVANGIKMAQRMGFKDIPRFHVLNTSLAEQLFGDKFIETASNYGGVWNVLSNSFRKTVWKFTTKMKQASAFAYMKKRVIYTEHLLEELNQDEIDGVTAHELTHLKADHINRKNHIEIPLRAARLVTQYNLLLTTLDSWHHIGVMGATIGTAVLGLLAYDRLWSKPRCDDRRAHHSYAAVSTVALGSVASVSMLFNAPAMSGAMGLALLAGFGGTMISKSFSRRNEYQCDRVAGEITENPAALGRALKKIVNKDMIFEYGMDIEGVSKPRPRGLFSQVANAYGALFRTHPEHEKRIACLNRQHHQMHRQSPLITHTPI